MASGSGDGAGCGCLLIIIFACVIGGGVWEGIAILAAGWLAYLVFIGVSVGIIVLIVKAFLAD